MRADQPLRPLARQLRCCFRAAARSVPAARREVVAQLDHWGMAQALSADVAELTVSELVTNAVHHAANTRVIEVVLEVTPCEVIIGVHDCDPTQPDPTVLGCPTVAAAGGRGLFLVREIAAAEGGTLVVRLDPDRVGKTVEVTVPLHPAHDQAERRAVRPGATCLRAERAAR